MIIKKLEDKVALITGGSRGIGRASALRLAQEGCDVVVNYVKDEKAAQSAVKEIEKLGRKAISVGALLLLLSGNKIETFINHRFLHFLWIKNII